MTELHFPWLELAIAAPAIGALLISRVRDPELAWKRALGVTGLTLLFSLCAWHSFGESDSLSTHDRWGVISSILGENAVVMDEISAPLIPLAALLYFLVTLATLRTKVRRFPLASTLVSLSLLLALLSCRAPWAIVVLLAAQVVPPNGT